MRGGRRRRVASDCSVGFGFFLWPPVEKLLLAREGLQWWGLELHSGCPPFSWLSTPLIAWTNCNEILISATFCLTCVHHKHKITFQTKRHFSLTFCKGALFTGKLSKEVSPDFFFVFTLRLNIKNIRGCPNIRWSRFTEFLFWLHNVTSLLLFLGFFWKGRSQNRTLPVLLFISFRGPEFLFVI